MYIWNILALYHIHIHKCTYIHIHIYIHAHAHVYMNIYIYEYINIYIYIYICHLLDLLLIREVKKPVISETRSAAMLPHSHTCQIVSNLNYIIMKK